MARPSTPSNIMPKLPQFTLLLGAAAFCPLEALGTAAGTVFVAAAKAFVSSGALVAAMPTALVTAGIRFVAATAFVADAFSSSGTPRSGRDAEARERLVKKE